MKIVDDRFDFEHDYTVQVFHSIFSYRQKGSPGRLQEFMISGENELLGIYERARPLVQKVMPSLLNFDDQYIFVVGGGQVRLKNLL